MVEFFPTVADLLQCPSPCKMPRTSPWRLLNSHCTLPLSSDIPVKAREEGSSYEHPQTQSSLIPSLVPSPCVSPGEKRSDEPSRISWAGKDQSDCVISNYYIALPLQQFISTWVSVPFLTAFGILKCFEHHWVTLMLKYSPRKSTWFTRPFLLMREGWVWGREYLIRSLSTMQMTIRS